MNKKNIIIIATVLVVLITIVFLISEVSPSRKIKENNSFLENNPPIYTEEKASSTIQISKKTTSLQEILYKDNNAKFSIQLPLGWSMSNKENSTTSASTWFSNASSTMVISRYSRTTETEKTIEELGPGGFLDIIVNNIVSGFNKYQLISTKSVNISGNHYRQVISTYVGLKTQKQVTQYIYLTIREDSYYVIGIDIYSDTWDKSKGSILESINSLKLL